jgi:hypothetical protein
MLGHYLALPFFILNLFPILLNELTPILLEYVRDIVKNDDIEGWS